MQVELLPTPALLVDLPIMEANLEKMGAFFRSCSAKLRPHFKNHRVLALADRQLAAGAQGMTCSRLWQAELLVNHGIHDVLIANEIAGRDMILRFTELSHQAPVIVAVDCPDVIDEMAVAAGPGRSRLNVVVDIDLGLKRCGVGDTKAALALARKVLANGLRLRGIMGYEGHLQQLTPGANKDRAVNEAMHKLVHVKRCLEEAQIPVEIVSCGGTGDYSIAAAVPGVTEIQAGSYLLMDSWYEPVAKDFRPTLAILCTVISVTAEKRIVVDAGVKAISGERGLPSVLGLSGLRVTALHAEHAIIEILDPALSFRVGEKLTLRVHYHDGTIQLHRQMHGVRNGVVEQTLLIEHGI